MTLDAVINAFSVAIAYAEGWYVNGSRPRRNHNPGDLTIDTIGLGVGYDGPFVIYANDDDGWQALRVQVRKIFENTSSIYNSNMTIQDIARKYTTTEQTQWAINVASKLGVSPDTRVSDLVTLAEGGIGAGAIIVIGVLAYLYYKS